MSGTPPGMRMVILKGRISAFHCANPLPFSLFCMDYDCKKAGNKAFFNSLVTERNHT